MFSIIKKMVYFIWDQMWFLLTLRPRGSVLPPSCPGRLPILGNMFQILGDGKHFWKQQEKWSRYSLENGGIVLVHAGPKNVFFITDPDEAMSIANNYFDKPYIYDFAKSWLANGLITAKGHIWKPSRKAIAPAFSANNLHDFLPVFNDTAKKFADCVSENVNKGYFNPWDTVVQSLLGNICQTIFGLRSDDKYLINKYSHVAEDLLNAFSVRLYRFWLHIPIIYRFSSIRTKFEGLSKSVKILVNEIIRKRKTTRSANNKSSDIKQTESFMSLLDYLLDTNEKRNIFMEEDIRAHLDTMAVAAFDTTSSGVAFVLALVGSHPHVQDRIQKELAQIFENSNRDVEKQDLIKLVYLEAVIKEGVRLYPSVPLILRSAEEEVKLKNYTLPAHSIYAISLYAICRHPMWGKDANQFRPERWLEPGSLPENPNALASFSLGKRNCIGKYYAMVFMKTMLAHFFRRYRVTSDIQKLVLKWDVTLRPFSGHEITLESLS